MDVRALAGDTVEIRAQADRKGGGPPAPAAEVAEAQGRDGPRQRLRRGPRRRVDLPQYRAVRQDHEADQASVVAVDDSELDPGRIRPPARGRDDASACRRGGVPV